LSLVALCTLFFKWQEILNFVLISAPQGDYTLRIGEVEVIEGSAKANGSEHKTGLG
jgi:hypothetical protein